MDFSHYRRSCCCLEGVGSCECPDQCMDSWKNPFQCADWANVEPTFCDHPTYGDWMKKYCASSCKACEVINVNGKEVLYAKKYP